MQSCSINTFLLQIPVPCRDVKIRFIQICGLSGLNKKTKNSFSIVVRISGLSNIDARIVVVTDYGAGVKMTDNFELKQDSFIFSNQTNLPAAVDLRFSINGKSDLKTVSVKAAVKMVYLKKIIRVVDSFSAFSITKVATSNLLLLQ